MRHITIMICALFCLLACAGEAGDGPADDTVPDVEVTDDLGALEQGWTVRPSATGGRTLGVSTSGAACTKTSSTTCRWVGTINDPLGGSSAEQIIKICVTPVNWTGSNFSQAVADVDLFVGNMFSTLQGSAIPYSFSRVVPAGGGSDCATGGANIIIHPGITSEPYTANYRQYVTPTFSGCTTMSEPSQLAAQYQRCNLATINAAYLSLGARGSLLGLSASRIRTQKTEALHHGLLEAMGIGSQTSNTNHVSNPTMSNTSSKFFMSNEEVCRMKTLVGSQQTLFSAPGNEIVISATTCAN